MNVLFLILKLWIIIINKIKFSFVFNYLPNCSSKIIFDDDDNDADGDDGDADGDNGDGDGDDSDGDDDNDGDELLLSDWWLSSLFIIDNIFLRSLGSSKCLVEFHWIPCLALQVKWLFILF